MSSSTLSGNAGISPAWTDRGRKSAIACFHRSIRVVAPEGSFVNPRLPAPVGTRGQSGYRCRTAVLGPLAKLIPGGTPACPGGSEFGVVFAAREGGGAPFPFLEFHNVTGRGGSPDRDGQDAGPFWREDAPVAFVGLGSAKCCRLRVKTPPATGTCRHAPSQHGEGWRTGPRYRQPRFRSRSRSGFCRAVRSVCMVGRRKRTK